MLSSSILIQEYRAACFTYEEHLTFSIVADVKKITNINFLNSLSSIIGGIKLEIDDSNRMEYVYDQEKKEKMGFNLRGVYLDSTKKAAINSLLDEYKLLTLKIGLQKYQVVKEANNIFDQANQDGQNLIGEFRSRINENKNLLLTRRDTHLITFLKTVGCFLSTCLPVIGNFFAYRYTFGDQATHGHKFVDEIENINKKTPTNSMAL